MIYSRTVTMRNTMKASEEISSLADRVAPSVDLTCDGATTKEITYRMSGERPEVDKLYAAGQRARLW